MVPKRSLVCRESGVGKKVYAFLGLALHIFAWNPCESNLIPLLSAYLLGIDHNLKIKHLLE
jgi:hypothetical protein